MKMMRRDEIRALTGAELDMKIDALVDAFRGAGPEERRSIGDELYELRREQERRRGDRGAGTAEVDFEGYLTD